MRRNVVVYGTDANYTPIMSASILSVIENNRKLNNLTFVILENHIGDDNKNKIIQMCSSYEIPVYFYKVESYIKDAKLKSNFNMTAFSRLFIGDILSDEKVLYLDCDTIVNGDLSSLFSIELGDKLIAAVQDTVSKKLRTVIGLSYEEKYINSGVMLINLKQWRSENIKARFFECIKKFNGDVPHNDQGIINSICHDRIYILDPKYNMHDAMLFYNANEIKELYDTPVYYNDGQFNKAKLNPIIIHYTEAHYGRPWFINSNHPYKNLFTMYRKKVEKYWPIKQEKDSGKKVIKRKIKYILYSHLPFIVYSKLILAIRAIKEF